jgi:AmiR/NasT family two-component response regulator
MRLFSVAAGQAITNARRWQHSRETVTQLEGALLSRSDIDMAKGALIARHGCNPDEAFARLVDQSQRRNAKLHVIAQELLASLQSTSAD